MGEGRGLPKGGMWIWCKSKDKMRVLVQSLSCIQLLATPWTVACQAPLSMGFPRQESWSELLSSGDFPDLGIEPTSLALAGGFFNHLATREVQEENRASV